MLKAEHGNYGRIPFAEKFAELIIQECADVLMKPEYTMTHPDDLSDYNKGWVNGRLLGVEQINDRFSITP